MTTSSNLTGPNGQPLRTLPLGQRHIVELSPSVVGSPSSIDIRIGGVVFQVENGSCQQFLSRVPTTVESLTACTIYERICGLSDVFADHFINLLALLDGRPKRPTRLFMMHMQENGDRLSEATALDGLTHTQNSTNEKLWHGWPLTDSMHVVHTVRDLLKFQFASPRDYGLDVLWDGTPLQRQYADLHAGESRHSSLLYELEALDHDATNLWQQENRMGEEVNYVQLFQWIQDLTALWQDDISTVKIQTEFYLRAL